VKLSVATRPKQKRLAHCSNARRPRRQKTRNGSSWAVPADEDILGALVPTDDGRPIEVILKFADLPGRPARILQLRCGSVRTLTLSAGQARWRSVDVRLGWRAQIGCRENGRGPWPDRNRAAQIRIAIKGIFIVIKGTFYPDEGHKSRSAPASAAELSPLRKRNSKPLESLIFPRPTRDKGGWTNPLSRESCALATAPSEQQVCWSAAAVATGSSVSRVL
jgi:hypothetical protein